MISTCTFYEIIYLELGYNAWCEKNNTIGVKILQLSLQLASSFMAFLNNICHEK